MNENMKKYLELVEKDKALQQKMEALKDKSREQIIEGVIALAQENGITLTQADFTAETPDGELSDDELEAASGGMNRYLARYLYKELTGKY